MLNLLLQSLGVAIVNEGRREVVKGASGAELRGGRDVGVGHIFARMMAEEVRDEEDAASGLIGEVVFRVGAGDVGGDGLGEGVSWIGDYMTKVVSFTSRSGKRGKGRRLNLSLSAATPSKDSPGSHQGYVRRVSECHRSIKRK